MIVPTVPSVPPQVLAAAGAGAPARASVSPPNGTRELKLVLFISGFTQTTKTYHGVFRQFRWALDKRRELAQNKYRIELRPWRDDWTAVAEYCQTMGVKRVYLIAYSWGVGWGVGQLAPKLQARGIEIPWLISLDGVYRWGITNWARANPLNWRTVVNRGPLAPKLKIPSNVGSVYPLRQCVNKPQGHDFAIVNSERTTLHETTWVDLPHGEMDDSVEFDWIVRSKLLELWAGE